MKKSNKTVTSIILIVLLVVTGTYLAKGQTKTPGKPDIIVDNPPIISPENPKVGDEVEITYTLRPQPFQHNVAKPKEIVLVLDRSGSMDEKLNSNITKMNSLKKAGIDFIDKMSNIENLKIGIVSYSSYARIDNYLTDVKKYKDKLKQSINNMKAEGGTNSGDGIRKAGYILKDLGDSNADKTIVFMSDGEPTFYTYNYVPYYNYIKQYYTNFNNKTPHINRGNDYSHGTEYAYIMSDLIKSNINSANIFTVGYGMNNNGNKIMNNIHTKMGGTSENFYKTSANINDIFNKISDDIIAQYKIENQNLDLNLDNSVERIGDIKYGEIIYKRGEDGWYTAPPVQIKLKIKCNKKGLIDIVKQGSEFKYKDIFGKDIKVALPPFSINIDSKSKVTIQARDSSGYVAPMYNSLENVGNRYDKLALNDFGQECKLFGTSYADIKFEGDDINYVQYQFIKSDEKPNDLPENGWKSIADKTNGIPEDVDIGNPGYITQKSYDVSHMPDISKGYTVSQANKFWQNKNEVYKYPFSNTEYIPTTTAKSNQIYAREEIFDGKDKWIPNMLFTESRNLGRKYSEANKSWGYIKVPKTGDYDIQITSDDGFYGTITDENGKVIELSNKNMFSLHGAQNAYTRVHLKANHYYPIYLEYFNWGGGAIYTMKYSTPQGYKNIPSDWFYPSKNKTPGEQGDNIFTGEKGVQFPEDIGKYYIAYKAGIKDYNKDDIKTLYKSGVYGPFIIDERFTLTRNIELNKTDNTDYDYILNYTLTPNQLRVTDVYKTKQELYNTSIKDNIDIIDMDLNDKLPKSISVINDIGNNLKYNINTDKNDISKNELTGSINQDVNYELKKTGSDKKDWIYKSDPITINLGVRLEDINQIVFSENDGVLMYKDISLNNIRINKEQKFAKTILNLEKRNNIKQHGLFTKKGSLFTLGNSNQDVIEGMYYTVGIDANINRNNSSITIQYPEDVINLDSIKVYSYNGDKTLGKELVKTNNNQIGEYTIHNIGNGEIEIANLSKGNYVVIYESKFNKDTTKINAVSDGRSKPFNATLIIKEENGEITPYLPDLF